MAKGKIITLIGGIITLLGTYTLTWFLFGYLRNVPHAWGYGGIKTLIDIFSDPGKYAKYYGLPTWVIYILAAFVILFLISGILQILAIKNRKLGIIGSIMPFIVSIIILVSVSYPLIPELLKYIEFFGDPAPISRGVFPLNYTLKGRNESIGTYFIWAGAALGIIGSFLSREEYF
jgi:hypothetical protein